MARPRFEDPLYKAKLQQEIVDQLNYIAVNHIRRRVDQLKREDYFRQIRHEIWEAVEIAARPMFPTIARHYIGRFRTPAYYSSHPRTNLKLSNYPEAERLYESMKRPPGSPPIPRELTFLRLKHTPLSPRYVQWKKKRGLNRNMFEATGALKRSIARQSWEKFGDAIVDLEAVSGSGKSFVVANLEVNFFPRIRPNHLPLHDIHDVPYPLFEHRWMGPTNYQKLRGPAGQYRPLIPPLVAWYKRVVVPDAVFRRLRRYNIFGDWRRTR